MRPMKAPTEPIEDELLEKLPYPLAGSPKLDGFRCLIVDGIPMTSSMKPFQNAFVNETFRAYPELTGLDGELLVGAPNSPDAFHHTSGPLRRFEGKPDFKFYVFDDAVSNEAYCDRWIDKQKPTYPQFISVLPQRLLKNPDDVLSYEKEMLAEGYEGAMIRSLSGRYKQGRCTFNDLNIFKRKPFVDCEAVVIDILEAYEEDRETPKGTIGAFALYSPLWEKTFTAAPGKGFTAEMKLNLWNNRHTIVANREVVTVKYQKHGSREAPRLPSVIKIRPEWDR
jgi:DNA ligase-1